MAREGTVLESHRIGGDRPSPPPTETRVVNTGGGKGGTIIIIASTFFIGYLYYTRRLSNVFKAIQMPGGQFAMSNTPANPAQLGNIVPIAPSTIPFNPTAERRRVVINYPAHYNLPPRTIDVDRVGCYTLVYAVAFSDTHSPSIAEMVAKQACNWG
jgi:hypothetical protein